MTAGLVDQLGVLAVTVGQGPNMRCAHDVGEAHDGVQRRAQLVTHVGQEAGAAVRRRLGVAPGGFRRGRRCSSSTMRWSTSTGGGGGAGGADSHRLFFAVVSPIRA